MPDLSLAVQKLAVWALPVLFAVTLHEVAHGWAARALGDHTAERMGRLSLNPLKHVDPVGTLLVPAVLLLLGGFLFGWAKPVPVDFRNLRNPKKDMALVALAGPMANLAMAIAWGLVLRIALGMDGNEELATGFSNMAQAGIGINIALMVLNLFPLPPLDGGRVLVGVLPVRQAMAVARLEPYGMVILLLLMFTGVLWMLLSGPYQAVLEFVYSLIGIR